VAGEKLIPLGQELELCRAHLRVMSLRQGVMCTLASDGIDERAPVPPAIFHTLIENGLTHLQPRDGRQEFELRGEQHGSGVSYTLIARGRAFGARRSDTPAREGTGLRYIKARLEESFTGRWTMDGGPVDEGWKTVILIRKGGAASAPSRIDGLAGALAKERPA
jgi:LytS/YehU family sensor histidine kinase